MNRYWQYYRISVDTRLYVGWLTVRQFETSMVLASFFRSQAVARVSILLAGVTVFCASLWPVDSSALSLGRSRGTPLIGKPLDIAVLATTESSQDQVSPQCFEADIFYGETRLANGGTRISVEKSPVGADLVIRIRSSQQVDEPVVTVFLKAICQQLSTRRYVLLSEASTEEPPVFRNPPPVTLPAEQRLPVAKAANTELVPPAAPDAASAREQRRILREQAKEAKRIKNAERKTVAENAPNLVSSEAKNSTPASVALPAKSRQSSKNEKKEKVLPPQSARLELETADFFVGERSPNLRASSELLTPISNDPLQRSAAAALWKSLQADIGDVVQSNARLAALEGELAALRGDSKRQQQALQTLSTDLATAQSERYTNGFTIALILLSLCALVAAVLGWLRVKRLANASGSNAPWWAGRNGQADAHFTPSDQLHTPTKRPHKPTTAMQLGAGRESDLQSIAPTFSASDEWENFDKTSKPIQSMRDGLAQAKARLQQDLQAGDSMSLAADRPDFVASIPGVPRTVNAEELFDVQQQAEFFMSLGQHPQAIEILREHIREHPETSAMAYLDLFEIYHSLKLTHNYETLRGDFNRAFNGKIPAFDDYSQTGRGLEYYPRALSRIQSLWPSARVLDVIEESVFRKPDEGMEEGDPTTGFDLLAYRELLLLHSIAKDISSGNGDGLVPAIKPPDGAKKPPFSSEATASFSDMGFMLAPSEHLPMSEFSNTNLDQLSVSELAPQSLQNPLIQVMEPSFDQMVQSTPPNLLSETTLDLLNADLLDQIVFPVDPKRLGLDINLESIQPTEQPRSAEVDNGLDFDIDDAIELKPLTASKF